MVEYRTIPARSPVAAAKPLSRRARRCAQVQQRIFRAAMELFAGQGYVGTTVEQITQRADVGKGTFFYYFPTKEHLLIAFGEIRTNKIRAALDEALEGRMPVKQILWNLFQSLAEDYVRTPHMFRCVLMTMLANEPVRQMVVDRFREGRHLLGKVIGIGQKRREIRTDRRPAEMARAFQNMFFGLMVVWSVSPEEKLEKRLQNSFDVLWSAIELQPVAQARRGKPS